MSGKPTYCLDTSALTYGYYDVYRASQFLKVWDRLSDLVEEGRLVAPMRIYEELQRQNDELYQWVKMRKRMFIEPDNEQLAITYQLSRDFPYLLRRHKDMKPGDAWVIALARQRGFWVVSNENPGSLENPKIPFICGKYGITHIKFSAIIHSEQWTFD
jgi:hypothetical protein